MMNSKWYGVLAAGLLVTGIAACDDTPEQTQAPAGQPTQTAPGGAGGTTGATQPATPPVGAPQQAEQPDAERGQPGGTNAAPQEPAATPEGGTGTPPPAGTGN